MKASFKFYIFLQLILILSGCQGDTGKDATKGAHSPDADTSAKAVLAAQCELHKTRWDTLLSFTQNMVLDTTLMRLVKNESFDGLFSVSTLKGLASNKDNFEMDGFAGWWCWDAQAANGSPRLFIALEPIAKYNTQAIPQYPTADSLYISQGVFKYPEIVLSHEDYIRDYKKLPNGPDLLVDSMRINRYIRAFRSNFPYRMPGGSSYNRYANAFFMNDSLCETLNEFLDQFGTYKFPYVRYYFGFDKNSPINKLRLILVPVDADGKNIHINGNQPAYYLQHTFP